MCGVQTDRRMLLQVWGEQEMDMPLRVLNLLFQLGLKTERIAIECASESQSILAVLHVSDQRGAMLVDKLRSMVLIRKVALSDLVDRPAAPASAQNPPAYSGTKTAESFVSRAISD